MKFFYYEFYKKYLKILIKIQRILKRIHIIFFFTVGRVALSYAFLLSLLYIQTQTQLIKVYKLRGKAKTLYHFQQQLTAVGFSHFSLHFHISNSTQGRP